MYNPSDILLYDASNQPLMVYENNPAPDEGQYFSPLAWEHLGRFSPSLLYSPIGDGSQDVNQYDREMLLRISRKLYATMPGVAAASSQLANLTVGLGCAPLFLGDDPKDAQWGEDTEINLETNYYNSCTPYGLAFDWRTFWKLVSFLVDRDGDVGLVPFTDRNGLLKMTVYEAHRIGNRPAQVMIVGGKFDGYIINDGVVMSDSGYPLGYQVKGITPDDDRIYTTSQMYLIYNPFSFSKFRGMSAIVAAMRSAASLQEIEQGIEMTCKIHSQIFLQIKNEMGQAPRSKIKTLGQQITNTVNKTAGFSVPLYQDTFAGINYVRHKDEMKSFASQTPSDQTMKFLEHLQKGILLGTGIPYQWILNPESVSGPSARGIKEQIVRATQARAQMLNKYQSLILTKAVANGMLNGTIKGNYKVDKRTGNPVFTQWGLSQAAELMLDAGYDKQADVTAYLTGLMSADEILQKYGKRYKNTVHIREKNLRLLYDRVRAIRVDYPEFSADVLPQMQNINFVQQALPADSNKEAATTAN